MSFARHAIALTLLAAPVGAADEPAGKSGIAHFLEHLMFKGTKIHAPGEFSRRVAEIGGDDMGAMPGEEASEMPAQTA